MSKSISIKPELWAAQWRPLDHVLSVNVWNFTVKAGDAAVKIFKKSYELKRFNSNNGITWKQSSKLNLGGHRRGSLFESGSLKNSITYNAINKSASKKTVKVYTDPKAFNNTYSHQGFCFAAIHNSDDSSIRTGRVRNMPQRQFMPTSNNSSSVMDNKLKKLGALIFMSFP